MTLKNAPWFMLFSRIVIFASVQAVLALLFLIPGSAPAWDKSATWWPLTVAIADIICLFLLIRVFKMEGKSFWGLFRIDRQHIWGDLLALLVVTILMAPISYLPNIMLGQALFSSPEALSNLFIRPLPMWAVFVLIVLFPVMQGLTESPTYFGYVMPRLKSQGLNKWLAISLPALMLGFQHAAAPLLFNMNFILWRGLMFVPFAFLTGILFHWRPRLLPYFVVVHILMNISLATMFLSAAY